MNSFVGDDGKTRCGWCSSEPIYIDYHDNEWGRPVVGNDAIFERISLEAFQAGLNWLMILKRRDHMRSRFKGFSIDAVSRMDDQDVDSLMADPLLIRNQKKIRSVIANAKLIAEQDIPISDIVWSFRPIRDDEDYLKTTSRESTALSRELRRLGFSFVGPTTMYAMMQSIGMVNDHHPQCFLK